MPPDRALARDFAASATRVGLPAILAEDVVRIGEATVHLRAVPSYRFDRLMTSKGDPVLDKWLTAIPRTDWLAWRLPRLGWFVARPSVGEPDGSHGRYGGPHGPVLVAHLSAAAPAR